ncbi:hypothetical protein F183_A32030 [Bryobacterales bacterium F-183]|nr:hypothetical protein F183_A32030 [Bryobacterales bacterium F-183]
MNWNGRAGGGGSELTALLIACDPRLSQQFQDSLPAAKTFQLLGELNSYPNPQTLEMRLNQYNPQAVLVDLSSDLETAAGVIQYLAGCGRDLHIVGLHSTNDSPAILRSLRAGASEFLHAPFDPQIQREAVTRLVRMRQGDAEAAQRREFAGNLIAVSSTKPGSGSSTIAVQTAFALGRLTGSRVLLADFDLMGGALGFYLKLESRYSLIDAMIHAESLDPENWGSLAEPHGGIDILPAPIQPENVEIDNARLSYVLDSMRHSYDWIVVDLPMIFQRISMIAASQADRIFLVTTSELPSLHLARKSVALLEQIGLPKERVQMLVNRISRWDGIGTADLEKLFNCPVYASLPNDYFPLHRAISLGQPLGSDGDLGKAIDAFAAKLANLNSPGGKRPAVDTGSHRSGVMSAAH